MTPGYRGLAPFLLAGLLVLGGCADGVGGGSRTPTAEPGGVGSDSATPAGSASPSVDGSASPTPAGTATPPGSPTPGSTSAGTAAATPGGTQPSATVAPSSCPTVNPIRVNRAETSPRRAIEVVTLISDGTNLTTGTREQTDFLTPALTAPDGTTITDDATFRKIATLVAGQRHRVLLTRPEPPDTAASTSRKPFSSPGTYVVYNASSQLVADVVVQCSGAELIWTFVSEADPSSGQVNCAVEPPRTNALARVLFQNNC
jgi:hypothetical protein